jgi:hypothetical protein
LEPSQKDRMACTAQFSDSCGGRIFIEDFENRCYYYAGIWSVGPERLEMDYAEIGRLRSYI